MKKLYLVDVSSMFFRAFYAIPPLTAPDGLPTNALYGFTSMCIRLLRESKPDFMVFCYDRPEPSFRSELYHDYKANRSDMPDDLKPQMPFIKQIVDVLGIPSVDKLGYEADDLIGTLAKEGEKEGLAVIIVSGDKDFAQLVNEKTKLLDTMKNKSYDIEGVKEKWGVHPDQMVDYLAMVGDSSDNIPGVRGIGPKGAEKLLKEFNTLDGIYSNIDRIKGATQQKLIEGKDNAKLAKKLVTIVTDLKLDRSLNDFRLKPLDKPEMIKLFERLGFTALVKKFSDDSNGGADNPAKSESKDNKSEVVTSVVVGPTRSVKDLNLVTWDLSELQENLEPYSDVWVTQTERGFCFATDKTKFQITDEASKIGEILSEKNLVWRGFDVKKSWRSLGVKNPSNPAWDNMLAAYVLKAGDVEEQEKVYGLLYQKKWPDLLSPEETLDIHRRMEGDLRQKLEELGQLQVLEKFELPLVPILHSMESLGVAIDLKNLSEQSAQLFTDIQRLEKEIHNLAGGEFNIASPKQLAVVLFEKLRIPSGKKTKTGFSTGSDILEKNAKEYPVCARIIDFRELSKLKSTYVDALPSLVSASDHRLHTVFHQAVTSTGRLSSTSPNLQNIPIRTERGRLVRKAFVAPPGKKIVSVDYSQIELRVLAEISGDPNMRKAFMDGHDVHAATAAEVFDVAITDVTPEQRRMAKAVNFGIAYGQGAFGLADQLGISRQESKAIIDNYFRKFHKVRDYMQETVIRAKEQGYVETFFGRRRYLDELKSSSQMVRKFGERAAINAPMQGTASDLVKLAMIQVFESIEAPLILQVHDELLFEIDDDQVAELSAEIKKVMEGVAQFSVPLVVNVASGQNWDQAH